MNTEKIQKEYPKAFKHLVATTDIMTSELKEFFDDNGIHPYEIMTDGDLWHSFVYVEKYGVFDNGKDFKTRAEAIESSLEQSFYYLDIKLSGDLDKVVDGFVKDSCGCKDCNCKK